VKIHAMETLERSLLEKTPRHRRSGATDPCPSPLSAEARRRNAVMTEQLSKFWYFQNQ
jgi:hypothetical protein